MYVFRKWKFDYDIDRAKICAHPLTFHGPRLSLFIFRQIAKENSITSRQKRPVKSQPQFMSISGVKITLNLVCIVGGINIGWLR